MFELRPYQTEIVEAVRAKFRNGKRRVLVVSPTGSGKTVLTAAMIRGSVANDLRVGFAVHRKELLRQTSGALDTEGAAHGIIAAGFPADPFKPIQLCSVQTLARRTERVKPFDVLIIDEAHHATAATYSAVLEHSFGAFVIGLTATPCRTDGAGLDAYFDDIVLGPDVRSLIDDGYLADFRVIAPPTKINLATVKTTGGDYNRKALAGALGDSTIYGDAPEHYLKYVAPRTMLVYCVNRSHARDVAERYRRRGIDAVYCGGDTPDDERERIIAGFATGSPRVIVSVDLFGEGLDVKGLTAVQLLRPTKSLSLHLQQIGRALRPNGEVAVVLDHVGNTLEHGFPDDDRAWSLEGVRKRKKEGEGPALRSCPSCFAVLRAGTPVCVCGFVFPPPDTSPPDEVAGELVEIDREAVRAAKRYEEKNASTLEDLVRLAIARGHKPAWAGIRYALRKRVPKAEAIAEAYRLAQTLG